MLYVIIIIKYFEYRVKMAAKIPIFISRKQLYDQHEIWKTNKQTKQKQNIFPIVRRQAKSRVLLMIKV